MGFARVPDLAVGHYCEPWVAVGETLGLCGVDQRLQESKRLRNAVVLAGFLCPETTAAGVPSGIVLSHRPRWKWA
jgi:hypothetical protein